MKSRQLFLTRIGALVLCAGAWHSGHAAPAAAPADTTTANLAVTSTYVWRGVAQTFDAALQGGVDYRAASGVHIGGWTSNVANPAAGFGSELDLTVGFAGKAGNGVGFDVGLTAYMFPQYEALAGPTQDFDFQEVYAKVTKDTLGAELGVSSQAGTYVGINIGLPKTVGQWDLGVHIGIYDVKSDFDGLPGEDYNEYNVSLSRNLQGMDVRFTLSDTDLPDDSFRTFVTVSKEFSL